MLVDVNKIKISDDRIKLEIETPYGLITQAQHRKKTPPAVYFATRICPGDDESDTEVIAKMYDGTVLVGWAQPTELGDKYFDSRYEELALGWWRRKKDYYGEAELKRLNLYFIRLNARMPKVIFVC